MLTDLPKFPLTGEKSHSSYNDAEQYVTLCINDACDSRLDDWKYHRSAETGQATRVQWPSGLRIGNLYIGLRCRPHFCSMPKNLWHLPWRGSSLWGRRLKMWPFIWASRGYWGELIFLWFCIWFTLNSVFYSLSLIFSKLCVTQIWKISARRPAIPVFKTYLSLELVGER